MIRLVFLSFLICLTACSSQSKGKTVFIPILARNQAHFLPRYLKNLENIDYDKKLIDIYVNTNNNDDNTEEILRAWVKKNKSKYRSIALEIHEIPNLKTEYMHRWNPMRLRELGKIRNHTLELAKKKKSDFYFITDCDNFVASHTLTTLIRKEKPIIAPLLYDIPDIDDWNANYYSALDEKGYFALDGFYYPIFYHKLHGCIKVPLVHCTYLIKGEYLDKLSYIDETKDHEFVIFSRSARSNEIDQYICNEKDFGVQFAFLDKKITREEEIAKVQAFLALP